VRKLLVGVARELARYDIDIAAISETRISAEAQFEEVGAGYTFFTIGQPEGKSRQTGVGFAIKSTLVSKLQEDPKGVNPRLMYMKLELSHGHTAVLLSAYAPTMDATDQDKERTSTGSSYLVISMHVLVAIILPGHLY